MLLQNDKLCDEKSSQQSDHTHKSGASGGEVVDGFGAGDIVLDGAEAVFVVTGALFEFIEAVVRDLFGVGMGGL